MNCVLSKLKNWKVIPSNGASESFFISGILEKDEVMVKFALRSPKDDNSLEIERNFYMYVTKHLVELTPHLLGGLFVGSCSIETFSLLKNKIEVEKLKEEWVTLADPEIDLIQDKEKENRTPKHKNSYDNYNSDSEFDSSGSESESNSEQDDFQEHKKELIHKERSFIQASKIILSNPKKYTNLDKVYFVVTPKLKGVNLSKFIKDSENKNEISSPNFALEIALQLAQVLTIFENKEIRHNDLHTENIFIEVLAEPRLFTYIYPFEFKVLTKYKITIFDYDKLSFRSHGWVNKGLETDPLCKEIGECDEFVKNADWYMILTFLIGLLESVGIGVTPLRIAYNSKELIDIKNFKVEKDKDAALGRACMCKEVKKISKTCNICHKNIIKLDQMIGPVAFIKLHKDQVSVHY